MSDGFWTEERVKLLRSLHGRGVGFDDIAAEIGHGATKNAIIGKARRLHLPKRRNEVSVPDPRLKAERDERERQRRREASQRRRDAARGPAAPSEDPETPRPIEEVYSGPVRIEDLRHDHCRWPTPWEPVPGELMTYCGRRRDEGQTYCEAHRREARSESQPGRRIKPW